MANRDRKLIRRPEDRPPAATRPETLPELSNADFTRRLEPPRLRRETIRHTVRSRFLARWSAP